MRKLIPMLVGATFLPLVCLAQQPSDRAMLQRIEEEGIQRSQVGETFFTLTDVIGGRLTGSLALARAANWARDILEEWGTSNAHLELFDFAGPAWAVEKLSIEMTAPRYMPLTGYAEAWTPSTDGVVRGTPVYLGDRSTAWMDSMSGLLRNAIVLVAQPQLQFRDEDRPQPGADVESVRTGNPPGIPTPMTTPLREVVPRLREAGAAVMLRPSPHEHGTVLVLGSVNTPPDDVPSIIVAAEQYNMIVRLIEAGEHVDLRIELETQANPSAGPNGINVIAEIPGTDPELRNEVVLIGAHLDSWHSSNGATDNGDAAASTLEAMRILAAVGAQPRRTIRMALWGGEEQGLLGSRAYIEQHVTNPDARDRIVVYLNDDPGSGATYGFYMEGDEPAKAIFDAWLQPLRHLDVTRNVVEGIGSTDHVPFREAGIPAYTTIKDFSGYDSRSRHTNQDFLERVAVEDLQQSAVVLASFAWQAAMRDEIIPPPAP